MSLCASFPASVLIDSQVNIATYLLFDRAPSAPNPSQKSVTVAISLLVFTAAVLRAEVVLFLGPLCLQLLYLRQVDFVRLLKIGLISTAISVGTRLFRLIAQSQWLMTL